MISTARRFPLFLVVVLANLFAASALQAQQAASPVPESKTIARCGQGWLETIDGYPVLHLKGTRPTKWGTSTGPCCAIIASKT